MTIDRFSRLTLGTGLSGTDLGGGEIQLDASSSGIPATIVDVKGDLIAASAADTVARLPVGSNDQVLVADSGQTLGLKWAAVPGTSAFVPVSTIDAKGDLLVGTANDALDNLPVGSNNQVLTADSAQTMGVKWATPATGAVATDAIWDTKGDLAVASGADAASKLAVGSDTQVLTADSAQTLGVKWATPAAAGGVTVDSFVTFTSGVVITGTAAASTTTIVTAGAFTADGTSLYCIEFYCYDVTIAGGATFAIFCLFEGSTEIGRIASIRNSGGANQVDWPVFGRRYITPTAASHTYKVTAYAASASTVTVNAGAGASGTDNPAPGYIRITHGG